MMKNVLLPAVSNCLLMKYWKGLAVGRSATTVPPALLTCPSETMQFRKLAMRRDTVLSIIVGTSSLDNGRSGKESRI